MPDDDGHAVCADGDVDNHEGVLMSRVMMTRWCDAESHEANDNGDTEKESEVRMVLRVTVGGHLCHGLQT